MQHKKARFSLAGKAALAATLAGFIAIASLPVVPALAQSSWGQNSNANLDFLRIHNERLHRLVSWRKQNPRLAAGVTPIIVPRQQMSTSPGYDPVVTRVIFYNRVFFDFDRSSLSSMGNEVIQAFSGLLRQEPTAPNILIAGHTDSLGAESYNFQLSEQRAKSVAYRLNDTGIPLERMRMIAMGEIQPMTSNGDKNGQATNRRVEFFISNSEEANEIAAQSVRFDPCHRNDHPGAGQAEACVAGQTKVSIRQLLPGGATNDTGRSLNLGTGAR